MGSSFSTLAIAAGIVGLVYYYLSQKKHKKLDYKKPGNDSFVPYTKGKETWCVEPDGEVEIKLAKTGEGAAKPLTVMEVFEKAVARNGENPALRWEEGGVPGKWKTWTWQDFYDDAKCAGRAFIKLGLEKFESVNILGFNSPQWLIANMGAIAAGGKAVGIYATNNPEACQYISEHSEAPVVVVENEAQLAKYLEIHNNLPKLKAIVVYNGPFDCVERANATIEKESGSAKVYSWPSFMDLGVQDEEATAATLKRRIEGQRAGHCCTLIYTSGTTGKPKAVMISHDNITWSANGIICRYPAIGEDQEHFISYLPLSHIAAQLLDLHIPLILAANRANCTVHFARADALKGSLKETLVAVRPTMFFGVPRVWEKFSEAMKAKGKDTKGVKKSLVTWAKSVGLQDFMASQVEGDGAVPVGFPVAQKLVFSKVRVALGLDRCKVQCTAAAPISLETLKFFGALGIPIMEAYGMSECTGVATQSLLNYFQIGWTGSANPGVELMLDHDPSRDKPGEGEICFRGRHIMMGYMKDADKTRAVIDPNGYLHSGDVGFIDETTGLLRITGRIKELIVTAGGENIAPVPIEDSLKLYLPGISNAMMVGDKRKYNVVLITLKSVDQGDGTFSEKLTGASLDVSADSKTLEDAKKDPKWNAYITEGIKRVNSETVSRAAKIQYFALVPEFSIPGNDLTPTLKLKRSVVQEKHKDVIDSLYQPKK